MPGISIVIPTWNGLDLLKQFLPSVLGLSCGYQSDHQARVEILIVDDGSTDGSADWLMSQGFKEEEPTEAASSTQVGAPESSGKTCESSAAEIGLRLRLIRNGRNLGFGKSCNRGIRSASCPLILLLNNDVEVHPGIIEQLARHFDDPSVFAAHCRVFSLESGQECGTGKIASFSRGFIRVHESYVTAEERAGITLPGPYRTGGAGAGEPVRPAVPAANLYSAFAGGGSAMFDRDKFIEIGGFDELLNPFYWEDVELSYRAWKRGYWVVYEPGATVRHRISSTIRKLDRRSVRRIQERNRLIYHWIHLQDRRYLFWHGLWVALLTVTSPLRLNPGFALSVLDAVRMLPEIADRRKNERSLARRTDREVVALFKAFSKRPDIQELDRYRDRPRP